MNFIESNPVLIGAIITIMAAIITGIFGFRNRNNKSIKASGNIVAGRDIIIGSKNKVKTSKGVGLKNEKIEVEPIIVRPNYLSSSPAAVASSDIFSKEFHKCSNCNFGFYVDNGLTSATAHVLMPKTATCPKCQNVDRI